MHKWWQHQICTKKCVNPKIQAYNDFFKAAMPFYLLYKAILSESTQIWLNLPPFLSSNFWLYPYNCTKMRVKLHIYWFTAAIATFFIAGTECPGANFIPLETSLSILFSINPLHCWSRDWVNPSKRGGMDRVSRGQSPREIPRSSPIARGKPCPSLLFYLDLHSI